MFGSFDIGSVFGIRARLHWTFVGLVVVLLATGHPFDGDVWLNALALSVLFTIVILHELGHGLVARHFGLQVLDVTLYPFGGVTRMSRIPEDPKIEGWIAFAGPAVNLALAFAVLPFAPDGALWWTIRDEYGGSNWIEGSAGLFASVNFSLALLNLLPAFPLDGGRIARALIALRTDWVSATRHAAKLGKWIALVMIGYGLYQCVQGEHGSFSWPIIGVVLWFYGVRELWSVRLRHAGGEFARAMGVPALAPIANSPAVAASPHAPPQAASQASADDPSGARRPSMLRAPESTNADRLSDDEIAALERFRGRIGKAQAPD